MDPTLEDVRFNLARALALQQRRSEAVEVLGPLIRHDPIQAYYTILIDPELASIGQTPEVNALRAARQGNIGLEDPFAPTSEPSRPFPPLIAWSEKYQALAAFEGSVMHLDGDKSTDVRHQKLIVTRLNGIRLFEVGDDAPVSALRTMLKDLGFERVKDAEERKNLASDISCALRLRALHALVTLRRENHDLGPIGTEDVYTLSVTPLARSFGTQLQSAIEHAFGSKIQPNACVDQILPLGWSDHRLIYLVERSLLEPQPNLAYEGHGSDQLRIFQPCEPSATVHLEQSEVDGVSILWKGPTHPRTPLQGFVEKNKNEIDPILKKLNLLYPDVPELLPLPLPFPRHSWSVFPAWSTYRGFGMNLVLGFKSDNKMALITPEPGFIPRVIKSRLAKKREPRHESELDPSPLNYVPIEKDDETTLEVHALGYLRSPLGEDATVVLGARRREGPSPIRLLLTHVTERRLEGWRP